MNTLFKHLIDDHDETLADINKYDASVASQWVMKTGAPKKWTENPADRTFARDDPRYADAKFCLHCAKLTFLNQVTQLLITAAKVDVEFKDKIPLGEAYLSDASFQQQ